MSAFDIDIGLVVKPPSPVPCRSSSSSPTSTLSDSATNISTNKKPRTPRKRPNQSYTEAVALLAKIHPNIFSAKNLMKHCKLSKLHHDAFRDSSELLLPPFPGLSDAGCLLHNNAGHAEEAISAVVIPENPKFSSSKKKYSTYYCSFSSPSVSSWNQSTGEVVDCDMDTGSLLEEEVGEGIDSIMGIPMSQADDATREYSTLINPYLGHLGGRYQMNMTKALRCVGSGDWWHSSPTIEIQNIVPSMKSEPAPEPEKKTRKNKNNKVDSFTTSSTSTSSTSTVSANLVKPALSLKLNYERVMKEWIGRGSLFTLTATDLSESPTDIIVRCVLTESLPDGSINLN